MKYAIARGIVIKGMIPIPKQTEVAVRTESTGDFKTLSLSDDKDLMIQVVVTPEVKKVLKDICK